METQSHPQTQANQMNGSNAHQPHYHPHGNPQFYSGHAPDNGTLTPEQNAENLAKYQREHAAQLQANLEFHGGHLERQHHAHTNPQFYAAHAKDTGTLTPEQNAENLARYNQEHAAQLAKNLASHGGQSTEHQYHVHKNPQFYGSGHTPDKTGSMTPEQNAENLAKYNHEHAAQLAKNLASHGGHSNGQQQKSSSGRSTPRSQYHTHKNPSFYGSGHGPDKSGTLTPEQNAENLAKYNREHATLLAKNLQAHGGHVDGDEYTPSRGAHHHPHFSFHHK